MSTKKSNKPELVLPEMEKSQTFNLSLNKDDLVDLYIDTVLTSKEQEIVTLKQQKEELVNQIKVIKIAAFSKHAKTLLKREFGSDLSDKVIEDCGSEYGEFFICFENGLSVYFKNKSDLYSFDTSTKNKVDKLQKEISKIESSLRFIDREIADISKSNKRLKAKLIKSLLSSTDDGLAILQHVSNLKDVKLLPNG